MTTQSRIQKTALVFLASLLLLTLTGCSNNHQNPVFSKKTGF